MNNSETLWRGVFGDAYQERNQFSEEEANKRQQFLEGVYRVIYQNCGDYPKSVLEIGAGQGQNLRALEKLSIKIEKPIALFATEINEKAKLNLKENAKSVTLLEEIPKVKIADLVFTYGVLIHTHPAHLRELLTKIYNCSNRWIMCVEYFSPTTRPIPYRGEKDALWLDDYGSHWLNNFPLRVIGYGFLWKKVTGLDNVTFWIMEKTERMN